MNTAPLPTRRSFLAGGVALSAAISLGACQRQPKGGLVLGDQVHLIQSKMGAAHVLDGVPYRLSFANFQGAAPLLEALNAGAVDTAPAGDLPIILAAASGCRLKIAAVNRTDGKAMAIIVPGHSPIASVKDLAGRSVIVSSARGSISHYLLLEALREVGVPASAVKIGFMLPTEAAAAFASGQIEAWATFGLYQVKAEAAGARILRDGSGIGPGYGILAVSEAALADPGKRAALADVLARDQIANRWCRDHLDDYAAIYARQTGIAPDLAKITVLRENPGLSAPDAAFTAALQQAADRFHSTYGVLPRQVDVASLIAPGLVPA